MSLTVKRKPKTHTFSDIGVDSFFAELTDIVDGDNMVEKSDPHRQGYNSYQIIQQTDGSFTYQLRNSGYSRMPITFTLDDDTDVATYFEFLKEYDNVYSGDKIVVEAEAQGAHKEYIIIRDGIDKLRYALRKNSDGMQEMITFTFFKKSGYSPKGQLDHLEDIAESGDTMEYIGYDSKFTFDIIEGLNGKLELKLTKKRKIGKSSTSSGKSSTSSGKGSTSSGKSSSSSGKGSSSSGRKSTKRVKVGGKRRRTRKGSR
jgi:uncharacterized membrane protein YgcG